MYTPSRNAALEASERFCSDSKERAEKFAQKSAQQQAEMKTLTDAGIKKAQENAAQEKLKSSLKP